MYVYHKCHLVIFPACGPSVLTLQLLNWVYQPYEAHSESHLSRVWLCDPMDYTVHGILQARILEWPPIPFCRGSSQPRDRTQHWRGIFYQLSYQGSQKHILKHPKRTFISKSLALLWAYLYPNWGKRNLEVVWRWGVRTSKSYCAVFHRTHRDFLQ